VAKYAASGTEELAKEAVKALESRKAVLLSRHGLLVLAKILLKQMLYVSFLKSSVRFIPSIGWVYLVVVLDWDTKKIVGWNLSLRSRSLEWREAMDFAIQKEFPEGVRGKELKLEGVWQSANFNILHEGYGIAWN